MKLSTARNLLVIAALGMVALAGVTLMAPQAKGNGCSGSAGGCGSKTVVAPGVGHTCRSEVLPGAKATDCGRAHRCAGMCKQVASIIDSATQAVQTDAKELALAELAKAKALLAKCACREDATGECDRGTCKHTSSTDRCSQHATENPKAKPGVGNTKCPIMGAAIDPANVPTELTRQYAGGKVGFCCAGCPQIWDKLSDTQKAAKLKAVN